jgi:adenylylsulfate kinase
MNADITWHKQSVSREDRERLNGHCGCVLWFTGLSGSGKSTIANLVDRRLYEQAVHTVLLDGDNIRHGLNAPPEILMREHGGEFSARFGLGFDAMDREENIRRIGAVAQLFCAAGIVTLTAFVSPYRRDREAVRQQVDSAGRAGDFIEVFVDTPLEVCERRDPKGLYQKARTGAISRFTGIDDPYEPPASPEIVLAGAEHPPELLAQQVIDYLRMTGKVS